MASLASKTAVVLALLAAAAFVLTGLEAVFLGFSALLLATILSYPLELLARILPRWLAALVTLLSLVGLMLLVGWLAWPTLVEQWQRMVELAPRALDRLEALRDSAAVPGMTGSEGALRDRVGDELAALATHAVPFAFGVLSALGSLAVTVVVAFFLAYAPGVYREGLLRLVPSQHVPTADELLKRLSHAIRGWCGGTLVSMAAVGSMTALAMLVLGVDSWLLLGVLAFFGEFIPYVGPLAAALPGVAVGFAESPTQGLLVTAAFVFIQQVEGQLLQPLVMKRAVKVQPAVLLLGQIALVAVFGLPAALIGTPLIACVQVAVGYLYVERALVKPAAA